MPFFNHGYLGRLRVFTEFNGSNAGIISSISFKMLDNKRVTKANWIISELAKTRRTKNWNTKRKLDESEENPDNPKYGCEMQCLKCK